MRTRKYLLSLLACLALGGLLCGCGGKNNADATPAAADSPTGTTSGKMSQDASKSGATGAPSLSNPGGADSKGK